MVSIPCSGAGAISIGTAITPRACSRAWTISCGTACGVGSGRSSLKRLGSRFVADTGGGSASGRGFDGWTCAPSRSWPTFPWAVTTYWTWDIPTTRSTRWRARCTTKGARRVRERGLRKPPWATAALAPRPHVHLTFRRRHGMMKKESEPGTGSVAPVRRCAIYTRKSTEEGLNQPFNTLEAQREAAEAYILSQRHLGWSVVADRYDDGD